MSEVSDIWRLESSPTDRQTLCFHLYIYYSHYSYCVPKFSLGECVLLLGMKNSGVSNKCFLSFCYTNSMFLALQSEKWIRPNMGSYYSCYRHTVIVSFVNSHRSVWKSDWESVRVDSAGLCCVVPAGLSESGGCAAGAVEEGSRRGRSSASREAARQT